jgi:Trypsin-like peptidase domain
LGLDFTVHEGIVSSLSRSMGGLAYVQLDAKINPGNSGGPVIDSRGRVVGIVTLKARDAEGIGLALPINYAYETTVNFADPPSSAAGHSSSFAKMKTQARQEMAEERPAVSEPTTKPVAASTPSPPVPSPIAPLPFVGGPFLVTTTGDDSSRRLIARVLRIQEAHPDDETITAHLLVGDEPFCTLKGVISIWKPLDVKAPPTDFRLPESLLRGLRAHTEQSAYLGDAFLEWDRCAWDWARTRTGGHQIEIVGGQALSWSGSPTERMPLNAMYIPRYR